MKPFTVEIQNKKIELDLPTMEVQLRFVNQMASQLDLLLSQNKRFQDNPQIRVAISPTLKKQLQGKRVSPTSIRLVLEFLDSNCFTEDDDPPELWSEFWDMVSWKALRTLYALSSCISIWSHEDVGSLEDDLPSCFQRYVPDLVRAISLLDYATKNPEKMCWDSSDRMTLNDTLDLVVWKKSIFTEAAMVEDWYHRVKRAS